MQDPLPIGSNGPAWLMVLSNDIDIHTYVENCGVYHPTR